MSRGFGSTFGTSASADFIFTNFNTTANPISYSLWFYPNVLTGRFWQNIFSGSSPDTCGLNILGGFSYIRNFTTQRGIWQIPNPSAGRWHHMTLTYDDSLVTNLPVFYVDGVVQAVTTIQAPIGTANYPSATNYYVGNGPNNSGQFDGMLAHFAVWTGYTLTPAEAFALYSGVVPLAIRPNNLGTYIPMDGVNSPEPDLLLGTTTSITGTRLGISDPPVQSMAQFYTSLIDQQLLAFLAARAAGANAAYYGPATP